jgi:hypothetical protein
VDGLLLPALITLLVLSLASLGAAAETRDGFAIPDEHPLTHH